MNIKFYFEFPYPNIDKEPYQPIGTTTSHLHSSILLFKKLQSLYPDINFQAVNSNYLNELGELGPKKPEPSSKYSHFFVIIENSDNKKYFVISYWDKLRGVPENYSWDWENMVELFACCGTQANEINYQDCGIKYTPVSNMCLHITAASAIEELRHIEKTFPEKLKFKGGNYDFRSHVYTDGRISIDNDRVPQYQFIQEYAKDLVMIDINAASEISHRTFDAFGLGAALIRPKLTIRYHNPLVPNRHYAALDCEDLGNWDAHLNAYFTKFEELKKNPDLVRHLGHQGRLWYEQNATTEAHSSLLSKLIDFRKLT